MVEVKALTKSQSEKDSQAKIVSGILDDKKNC
jgi:hypothetical protein